MSRLNSREKKAVKKMIGRLEDLAVKTNGYLTRIDRTEGVIELAKPIKEPG